MFAKVIRFVEDTSDIGVARFCLRSHQRIEKCFKNNNGFPYIGICFSATARGRSITAETALNAQTYFNDLRSLLLLDPSALRIRTNIDCIHAMLAHRSTRSLQF